METTQIDLVEELKRRNTKRDDLLREFEIHGSLTTGQIVSIAGTGMSSRLKELKRRGHHITCQKVRGGEWLYTYLGSQEDE